MKPFVLKKFSVLQSDKVFKVGTDAIVCGSLLEAEEPTKILEIGAGTGIIALMLAQRFPKSEIVAIEPHKNSYLLADENIQNSIFKERISLYNNDLQNFSSSEKWNVIVSNPPYFKPQKHAHLKHQFARNQESLSFSDIFEFAKGNLVNNGSVQLIYPNQQHQEIQCIAKDFGFNAKKDVFIKGRAETEVVRNFTIWKTQKDQTETKELIIEKSRTHFTDAYKELTKDFHPMF